MGKPDKLADGGSLFLWVMPNGAKYWRMSYRFNGKQKTLACGVYPDTSLKEAREKREAARKLLQAGTDPGEEKKQQKREKKLAAENSFEIISR